MPPSERGETTAAEIGRLRWRCRRGMRELDAILSEFLATAFVELGRLEKDAFAAVLDLPDPELHAYLVGIREAEDPIIARVIAVIRRRAGAAS